jgi:NAD-dependent dihydropyrimidine dehydrogenase PreA subunit
MCIRCTLCVFVAPYVYSLHLMCIRCTLCVFVAPYVYSLHLMCIRCTLCVFVVPYVYLLYYVYIVALTLDAGLLAGNQYPEGSATGHLDTGFSWFPCVYKRMLRWFPSFQVATTCLACSPPDLNFLATFFLYLCACKLTTAIG